MTVMWWHAGSPGWGGWLVMTLMMLALWGLLVGAAVALWRGFRTPPPPPERSPRDVDPRRVLDERFARGEIDDEEYVRRRELLTSGR